jgi:hypothetical protein
VFSKSMCVLACDIHLHTSTPSHHHHKANPVGLHLQPCLHPPTCANRSSTSVSGSPSTGAASSQNVPGTRWSGSLSQKKLFSFLVGTSPAHLLAAATGRSP